MGKEKISFEALLIIAILARPLIKWFLPGLASIEPIIPLAILAGIVYGPQKGAIVGVGGYLGSNILLASLGTWVFPQAIAGLIAGILPAIIPAGGKKDQTTFFIIQAIIATVIFEFIVNFWFGGSDIFGYFSSSLTFGFAHIVGNVFFAVVLSSFAGSATAAKEPEKKEEKKDKK